MADPVGAPTAVTTFAIGVLGFSALSRQGDVGYVTVYDVNTMLSDLCVRRWNSTSGGCTLTGTTDSLGGFFSPDSGAVVWVRDNNGAREMLYSRLSDCSSTSVGPGRLAARYRRRPRRPVHGHAGATPGRRPAHPDRDAARALVGANPRSPPRPARSPGRSAPSRRRPRTPTVIIYSVNGRTAADGVYIRIF